MKKETRDKALQLQGFIEALTWLPLITTDCTIDSQCNLMNNLQEKYDSLLELLEDE